ncbi:MAG: sigma-70 family RNA polymerase sigma factor [bacterium]|nr:sigma-70 family RNA polymerase sigma factor [bacterium]
MTDSRVDESFRRFAAEGDPESLAVVFDALASELLIVAAHISRSGAEAEDLVQSTFLAAIEARASYDVSRPVRPWLLGILSNQARANSRSARRTFDPDLLPQSQSISPLDQLEARDVVEKVAGAIDGLSPPFRQVLNLRLVHGFELAQIARTLGIPLSTVKSRLARGTDRLRSALPTGVAIAATLSLGADRLAAMRTHVLGSIPTVGVAVVAGGTMGTKYFVALAALMLSTLWFTQSGWWSDSPVVIPAERTAAVVGEEVEPESAEGEVDTVAVTQVEPERSEVDPVRAETAGVKLRGRLIAKETGVGMAGAVAVMPAIDFVNMMTLAAHVSGRKLERSDLAAGTKVGADGEFELEFKGALGVSFVLVSGAPDRVRKVSDLGMLTRKVHALGDVALEKGTLVTFTAVNEAGQPLADALFELAPPGKREVIAGEAKGLDVIRAKSDAAGRFELHVAPGVLEIETGDDHRLIGPKKVTVETASTQLVQLRLERFVPIAVIRGVVQDDSGIPLPGMKVQQFGADSKVVTDAAGRFEIEIADHPFGASLTAEGGKFLEFDEGSLRVPMPWDGKDVVLEMRRIVGVDLEVVRASTGEPVERFAVVDFGGFVPTMRMRTHENGKVSLPKSNGLKRSFAVVPATSELAATSILEIDTTRERSRRIVLQDKVPMTVRVLDQDGAPVRGSEIELLDPRGKEVTGHEEIAYLEELKGSVQREQILGVTDSVTDSEGRAVLRAGVGTTGLMLRIRGSRHVEQIIRGVTVSQREMTVTVAPACSITGKVGSPKLVRRLFDEHKAQQPMFGSKTIEKAPFGVFFVRGNELFPAGFRTFPISKSGEFEAVGVPAGDWDVHLFLPDSSAFIDGTGWSGAMTSVKGLRPGDARKIEFEIGDRLYGDLAGRVVLDGQPCTNRSCTVALSTHDDMPIMLRRVTTDAEGRFEAKGLLVGHYRLDLSFTPEAGGRHGSLVLPGSVEVIAGRMATMDFVGQSRKVRCRLVDADGEPLSGLHANLRLGKIVMAQYSAQTDADGWFEIDLVPYGPFDLYFSFTSSLREALKPYWQWDAKTKGYVEKQPGRTHVLPQWFQRELPAGETSAEWTLRLERR